MKLTFGCINELDYTYKGYAPLEDLINKNHGIMFTKTNVPMLLLSFESYNRIYGRAQNPLYLGRSPGGSSGGCGAITSLNASPISFGADIGGSIRMPANFCGVYGFKATSTRMPHFYSASCRESSAKPQEQILVTCGPISKSLDNVILGNKMMLEYHRRGEKAETDNIGRIEMYSPPMGFNQGHYEEALAKKKLKIGYFTYNGIANLCKASKIAMEKTIDTLKREGHELVEFDTTLFTGFHRTYLSILLSSGLNKVLLGDEDVVEDYRNIKLSESIPTFLRGILGKIFYFLEEYRKYDSVNVFGNPNVKEFHLNSFDKLNMTKKVSKYFEENNFDAVISPANSTPAIRHGTFKELPHTIFYTALWNYLDFPTSVIPRVHVTREEDTNIDDPSREGYQEYIDDGIREIKNGEVTYLKKSKGDETFTRYHKDAIRGSIGLPVGIQITTQQFEDERCLGITKNIDAILRKHGVLQDVELHYSLLSQETDPHD